MTGAQDIREIVKRNYERKSGTGRGTDISIPYEVGESWDEAISLSRAKALKDVEGILKNKKIQATDEMIEASGKREKGGDKVTINEHSMAFWEAQSILSSIGEIEKEVKELGGKE